MAESALAEPASVTTGAGPPARVLVVDPDAPTLDVLGWLLRERGYDVACVADTVDVRALAAHLARTSPDVLLIDAGALRQSIAGSAPLEELKQDPRWRDLPVIVAEPATSAAMPQSAARPPASGADDWVTKPLRVPVLLARLDTQLRVVQALRATKAALRETRTALERAWEDAASNRQIVDILHEVTAELSATEIYRVLARRVARALRISHCSVVLASAGDETGLVVASYDGAIVGNPEIRLDRYPEIVAALTTQRAVLVEDVRTDPLFADVRLRWREERLGVPVRSVIALPFAVDRWRSGVLFLRTEHDERALTSDDLAFAVTVIGAAVAAVKRAQALETTRADNRRLEALATTDPLTRLLNRRALLERLSIEVDRARRFKSVVTILMLDLDHFKAINDGAGHLAGDDVLRQVGDVLQGAVRTVDVAGRYGGEEFVLLLPETAQDGGIVFAERLRERIARRPFDIGAAEPLHLTASIGVATFPSPRADSAEDLIARADEALYRAKSGGRNQVRT